MGGARPVLKAVLKPVFWIGGSLEDLRALPKQMHKSVGRALNTVAQGRTPPTAKMLKGFGGASVQELRVWDERKNTYRAAYTVKFSTGVYVLHVFQKKSKTGIATPRHEIEKIRQRLKTAEAEHEKRLQKERSNAEDRKN